MFSLVESGASSLIATGQKQLLQAYPTMFSAEKDLAGLNPAQRDAVVFGDGPLVVFAGAGSGKTRVITFRIAHLIRERGVFPYKILAVTFTNKAAGEMRERLEKLVPGTAHDITASTFHSICARWMRRYADRVGVSKNFTIYDDADQKSALTRVIKGLQLDEKRFPARRISSLINHAKNEMLDPMEVPLQEFERKPIHEILKGYNDVLGRAEAVDFGDLIYRMVRALEADDAFREELSSRYQHILVDEFQDTNRAQFRLVNALSSHWRNLVVVGDDDQSIYKWRGADRRNILDFRQHFADAQVIKLEQNYRSTARILRVANTIIEKNLDREPKKLWTENEEGPLVQVLRCRDEREEAELVVQAARELRNEGRPLAEMAIFYRTHSQSRVIEEGLRAANLPYRIVGGMRFYDRAEIKDVLGYLRMIANSHDDVSFLRVVNNPSRGIGKTTIDRLMELAAAAGVSLFEAAHTLSQEKGGAKLGDFLKIIKELKTLAENESLSALARHALEITGYAKGLRDDDSPESDSRLENIEELVSAMALFEEDAEEATLEAFLELVTLQSDNQDGKIDPNESVTMMTVHAAKGLEFPNVLVLGMEENLFPMSREDSDNDDMEEERRLAYVAFTRARKQLTLSWASTRYVFGQLKIGQPSRFVLELPKDDVAHLGTSFAPPSSFGGGQFGGGRSFGADEYSPRRTSYGDNYSRNTNSARPQRSLIGMPPSSARGSASSSGSLPKGRPATNAGPVYFGKMGIPEKDNAKSSKVSPPSSSSVDGETYIDRSEGDLQGFGRGMKVRHVRYGAGRVLAVSDGFPPMVTVEFPGYGQKQIVATYLEPL